MDEEMIFESIYTKMRNKKITIDDLRNLPLDFLKNGRGRTLLHKAVICRCDIKIFKFLIFEVGCRVNVLDEEGNSTLRYIHGYYYEPCQQMVDLLLSAAKKEAGGTTELVSKLFKHDWHLGDIVWLNDLDMIEAAIRLGAEINRRWEGHYNTIDGLPYDVSALQLATRNGNLKGVHFLLDCGADPEIRGFHGGCLALHEAAISNKSDSTLILEQLLEKGTPVDIETDLGDTALQLAFVLSKKNMPMLLKYGASLEILEDRPSLLNIFSYTYSMYYLQAYPGTIQDVSDVLRRILYGMYSSVASFLKAYHYYGMRTTFSCLNDLSPPIEYWNIVAEYLAIVEFLGMEIEDEYEKVYFDEYHFRGCRNELARSKKFNISRNVNVVDILVKPLGKIVHYPRYRNALEQIERFDFYKNEFPCYTKLLRFKCEEAKELKILIDNAVNVLRRSLPLIGSIDVIIEKIVEYLGIFPLYILM